MVKVKSSGKKQAAKKPKRKRSAKHARPRSSDADAAPAVPEGYCEYRACGGLGHRKTKRPWLARQRVRAMGRLWNVCEGCAALIRARPSTAHLLAPPGEAGGVRATGRPRSAEPLIPPAPGGPRTPAVTSAQRESTEAWLFGEARHRGIEYCDLRPHGALWLVGGDELAPFVNDCRRAGVPFYRRAEGDPVTGDRPGWWTMWPEW
jgi:hypothetical protein